MDVWQPISSLLHPTITKKNWKPKPSTQLYLCCAFFFIADDYARLLEYEDQVQKLKAKVVVILINLHSYAVDTWVFTSVFLSCFLCLSAFSALTLLVGQQEGYPACKETEWWDAGMVICQGQGADFHMAQLMPLPLTISWSNKSRLALPSWFYLSGAGLPR